MCIFKNFPRFSGCTRWVELETVYSLDRMDTICAFLTENHIPHKVRAALLPAGANTVFPAVGTARSLWYLSVREADAARVQHYLHTERDY